VLRVGTAYKSGAGCAKARIAGCLAGGTSERGVTGEPEVVVGAERYELVSVEGDLNARCAGKGWAVAQPVAILEGFQILGDLMRE